jgi:hypothetical protein
VAELWLRGRPELGVDASDGFDPGAQQGRNGGHKGRLFHCG